jgi:hypothetical protein
VEPAAILAAGFFNFRRRNEVYKLSGVNGNIKYLEKIIDEIKANGLF